MGSVRRSRTKGHAMFGTFLEGDAAPGLTALPSTRRMMIDSCMGRRLRRANQNCMAATS